MSTAATCASQANDATAAAVYGPTPGNAVRSDGQPCAATTARRPLQRQRAPVVAQPAPQRQHVAHRRAASAPRREPLQPALVVRHHPQRLRLLEHHLADEQRVRVARRPPRQRPPHPLVPLQQRAHVHARRRYQRTVVVCVRFMIVLYDSAVQFTQGGERIVLTRTRRRGASAALVVPSTAAAAPLTVSGLTADRQTDPLGLGDARPALGWTLAGDGRGREQSAYQVVVSKDGDDVWDSGEVHSPASANVPYGGPALAVRHQVHVEGPRLGRDRPAERLQRARQLRDRPAPAERLDREVDRRARDDLNLSGAKWIWYTNDDATGNLPAMTRFLRATVKPRRARRATARFLFTADDEAVVYVNGTQVDDTKTLRDNDKTPGRRRSIVDVTSLLHSRRQHDRRPGQEPPQPERQPHARRASSAA